MRDIIGACMIGASAIFLISILVYCGMLSLAHGDYLRRLHHTTFSVNPIRMIFMIFVGVGFAVFFYLGAVALLFWLPPEGRETAAALVALVIWTTILPKLDAHGPPQ